MSTSSMPSSHPKFSALDGIAASAADAGNFRGFLEQMRELGYVDGANIAFDKRFAGGREELIEGYVADLPSDQSSPKARAAPPPAPAPKPVEAAPQPPEPAVEPPPERRAEEAAAAERAAQAEKAEQAAQAEREKRQADERAREKAAADQAGGLAEETPRAGVRTEPVDDGNDATLGSFDYTAPSNLGTPTGRK